VIATAAVCLAMNIYHEARGESIDGMIAVAQVTLNRVEASEYPDDICEVVYQRKQFSWTADPNDIDDVESYTLAALIAEEVIDGRTADLVYGALHYYAPHAADPYWANDFVIAAQIGRHVFLVED